MKKFLLLTLLISAALPSWGAVGRHNFLLNFNVGPAVYLNTEATVSDPFNLGGNLGTKAMIGFEIGYLLHSVRKSGTIHGMDLRFGVTADLPSRGYTVVVDRFFDTALNYSSSYPVLLNFSLGYTPGVQLRKFRLLFDVISIDLTFAVASLRNPVTGRRTTGSAFGVSYQLPLGTHFLFNNGFYFGVRHKLLFNIFAQRPGEVPLKYYVNFNIGYAFGK